MDLHFRSIAHIEEEISTGHKLWFDPAPGCDAVSATANAHGFTPVRAITRCFGWDMDVVEAASDAANQRGEVAVVSTVRPTLLLVPATKGHGNAPFLIRDLLRAASAIRAEGLHLTHFGYLQGRFPKDEVVAVLAEILGPHVPVSVRRIVFDIDSRARTKLYELLQPGR